LIRIVLPLIKFLNHMDNESLCREETDRIKTQSKGIRNKKVTLAVNAVTVFGVFLFLFFLIWIMYHPIHHAGGLQ
jgi:hypothetical protein